MKKILFIALFLSISAFTFSQDYTVPKDYKFETKEDYKPYEPQVKEAIDWYLNNTLSADPKIRMEVTLFVMRWMEGTPDVSIGIDPRVITFLGTNKELLLVFMMGWTKYSLENDCSKDQILCNKAGVEAAVNFYNKNRGFLKKDKEIEKYAKLMDKGKLEEDIKKKLEKK